MSDNIYQVIRETDLDTILHDNLSNLVVAMFSDKQSISRSVYRQMKLSYFELSQKYSDVFFVYIDLRNYTDTNGKHTTNIRIPRFTFYNNMEDIGNVEGMNMDIFTDTLCTIVDQLRSIKTKTKEETLQETVSEKPKLLHDKTTQKQKKKLGTSLSSLKKPTKQVKQTSKKTTDNKKQDNSELLSKYNITEDDYNELLEMQKSLLSTGKDVSIEQLVRVRSNMKNQNVKNNTTSNENDDEIDSDKQEKIKQLKELQQMQYMMQLNQFQKLEQLKKIKQLKEMQENNTLKN